MFKSGSFVCTFIIGLVLSLIKVLGTSGEHIRKSVVGELIGNRNEFCKI